LLFTTLLNRDERLVDKYLLGVEHGLAKGIFRNFAWKAEVNSAISAIG
jgi:hypothetical protein